jgi:hypothetical protein
MEEVKTPLKKIEFDPAVGELRTAKIEIEGFEPFEITFTVPGLSTYLDRVTADSAEDRGVAAVKCILKHLLKWSLAKEISLDSLERIALTKADRFKIFYMIQAKINEAGEDVKN